MEEVEITIEVEGVEETVTLIGTKAACEAVVAALAEVAEVTEEAEEEGEVS